MVILYVHAKTKPLDMHATEATVYTGILTRKRLVQRQCGLHLVQEQCSNVCVCVLSTHTLICPQLDSRDAAQGGNRAYKQRHQQ